MPTAKGFSLIEVMISIVIFSVGLLGLLRLQTLSLQHAYSAMLTSQAESQLVDMADQLMITAIPDISLWNNENNLLLPQGNGVLYGAAPHYQLQLFWNFEEKQNQLSLQVEI